MKLFFLFLSLCLPFSADAVDWRAKERLKADQGGIFFEPSPTASEAEIRGAFRFACHWNKNAPEDLRLPQLIVPYIGYWAGKRAKFYDRELRIASQYFSCFDRVFLGTAHVDIPEETGAAREYLVSGALEKAHRRAARELLSGLGDYIDWPNEKFHWFIPVEARLEQLSPPEGAVRGAGVKKALREIIGSFALEYRRREEAGGKEKRKRIMWAPRFGRKFGAWLEEKRPGGKIARDEVAAGFKEILKATPVLTDLTLLDDAGRSAAFQCEGVFCYRHAAQPEPMDCEADTVPYFRFLHELTEGSFISRIGVGLELQYGKIRAAFTERGWARAPGYVPVPFAEIERRRRCLARHKVPFGAAYELRYFHKSFAKAEDTYRYQYLDVPKGSAGFDGVRALVERGIAWPCRDTGHYFCPAEDISRADAAVYLHRAKYGAWADPTPAPASAYSDIPAEMRQRGAFEALLHSKALAGCGNSAACPERKITRGEFLRALLILRGEKPAPSGELRFYDVPKDGALAPWLLRADALKLPLACDDKETKFCPDEPLKRGEMAELLRAALLGG